MPITRLAYNRDVYLAAASTFLWGFGMWLFMYIHPLYIESLGASPPQIGLALGLSGVVGVILYIPVGLWADRFGRKPVILAGWTLGTIAVFAMALAPDWRWLILGLSVYAISNFAMPAFYGYFAAATSSATVNRTFAVISGAGTIGSIISPSIGGWIGEQYGLRAIYLAAALTFTISTFLLLGLSHQPGSGSVARETRGRVLGNRAFLWQVVLIFTLFFAIELGQVMVPNFLEDERGLSVGQIGQLGTVGAVGILLLTLAIGALSAERREGLFLSQLAALAALVFWLFAPTMLWVAVAYFVHGGNRIVRLVLDGRLAHLLTPETMSLGYGVREVAMRLGLAVAPYVAGLLYAENPTWPLYASAMALGVTLLLTFTLPARVHRPVYQ